VVLTVIIFESSPPQNFVTGILITFSGLAMDMSLKRESVKMRYLEAASPRITLLLGLIAAACSVHYFSVVHLARLPFRKTTWTEKYASVSIWACIRSLDFDFSTWDSQGARPIALNEHVPNETSHDKMFLLLRTGYLV
jgi:hypothetical protein